MEKKKRGQHYVWRAYFKPWTLNDQIYCLREGKIFLANIKDIANQRDFYRLREMSRVDLEYLKLLIEKLPKVSRRMHSNLVEHFSMIVSLKMAVEVNSDPNSELLSELDILVNNTEENLHSNIESKGEKPLQSMLRGDTSFFNDDREVAPFFHFLGVQLLRTKRVQELLHNKWERTDSGYDPNRTWQVQRHIFGVTLGGSLYVDRRNLRLALLDAPQGVPLLTSDNPVVNTYRSSDPGGAPEELEIYYPISPQRAMLLTPNVLRYENGCRPMSAIDADRYNRLIVDMSHEQIFSASREQLAALRDRSTT